MEEQVSVGASLAANIIDRIEELLIHTEQAGEAIEIDPHRGRLFELFVMAEAAGFVADDSEPDLSSDGVARELARRWDLAKTVGSGISQPSKLPPPHLSKMRLMWSFMRMWMEWTYAWKRWGEFHEPAPPVPPKPR